jgi:hypothetical protein
MSLLRGTCTAILCGIAFIAAPLVASARPKTENSAVMKKSLQLDDRATVDGKTLTPGTYEVLIDGNKVSFERDGKTVVTAPCQWETMPNKSEYNSTTLSATKVLQELEFEGSNRALEVM